MTLVIVATLAWPAMRLVSQSVTIAIEKDVVQVRTAGLRLIDGELLARLKDGQSVRVEFELGLLSQPGGAATVQQRQSFVLSYDLWEERFAVAMTTLPSSPSRSISHVSAAAAEAWCLQQLATPVSALGAQRNVPFWVRLQYRVLNGSATQGRDDGSFTLRGLIDIFSRRQTNELSHTIEAGPFRMHE